MLAIGSVAPEIDAESSDGPFRLSESAGRLCTVVYFFPGAFTPVCTREAATFRDNYGELALVGAALVGISTDDPTTQCEFAEAMKVPFPIVSDPTGALAAAYDVVWPLVGRTKRVTYVLSPKRVVLAVFHHELQVHSHRDDVLLFVDGLYQKRVASKTIGAP